MMFLLFLLLSYCYCHCHLAVPAVPDPTFWLDRESIIPGTLGFAISVCRLRERGCMSKSVYVRVFHDLELLRYVLRCAIGRQL